MSKGNMKVQVRAVAMPLRRKGMSDEEYEKKLQAAADRLGKHFEELCNDRFNTVVQELNGGRGFLIRGTKDEGDAIVDGRMPDGLPDIVGQLLSGKFGPGIAIPLSPQREQTPSIPEIDALQQMIKETIEIYKGTLSPNDYGIDKVATEAVGRFAKKFGHQEILRAIEFLEVEKAKGEKHDCGVPGCEGPNKMIPAVLEELKKQASLNVH